MKAMVINRFGGPEVFEAREMPKPEPGPTELLVKVYATSVNPVDYKIRQSGSWAGAGQIRPVVDPVMDLGRVAEAHRRLEAGGVRGKIALRVRAE